MTRGDALLFAIAAALITMAASCSKRPPSASSPTCETCDAVDDVKEFASTIIEQRNECRRQLAESDEPKTIVKTRTIKVPTPASPPPTTKCAAPPPKIEPVVTSPCGAATCLDATAEAALARNLAAYEAYVAACHKERETP